MIYSTVAGNLGGNAETKRVGENSVTQFSIASSRKVKGEEKTTWVRCSLWGERGEKLAQYLTKGSPVTVIGDMSVSSYEKEGQTKFSLDVRVSEIKLQGSKEKSAHPQSWDE